MRTLILFSFAVVAVFLAGSLLSYPVYLILSPVYGPSFQKVVHFTVLLTGIGGGLFYLKHGGRFAVLGFNDPRRVVIIYLFTGFISGLILLLVVEACLFLLGIRQIDPDLHDGLIKLSYAVVKAFVSGIFVGTAEEILFRGAIFTWLSRYSGNFYALTVSSLFYAAVHFIEFPDHNAGSGIYWNTGITGLENIFGKFSDPAIWDSFLTLFVLGVLLSMIRWNTGNIALGTGLHAGIVTINKIFSYATDYREGSPYSVLVNTYDHLTGYLATFWLVIACVFYYYLYMRKAVKFETC